jgi:transcriptional regulator with XRE-family HTH domain
MSDTGIASIIKKHRAVKGWTQPHLDETAGLPPGSTAQYENGRVPGIKALKRLARALGVSPLVLIERI